jgi:hypothetical protein
MLYQHRDDDGTFNRGLLRIHLNPPEIEVPPSFEGGVCSLKSSIALTDFNDLFIQPADFRRVPYEPLRTVGQRQGAGAVEEHANGVP